MMTTSKIKDPSSKQTRPNMMTQPKDPSKNKKKSTNSEDLPLTQNGITSFSNTSEFPMKPFKGTKSHLESLRNSNASLKMGKKRKSDSALSETFLEKEKKCRYDPAKVMSKLEQFSEVWNDCPDVENPKSAFEIVPNPVIKPKRLPEETNIGKKIKKLKSPGKRELSISNKSEEAQNAVVKNEMYDCMIQDDSYENKSADKNIVNTLKDHSRNDENPGSSSIQGKYDSKLAEIKRKKAVEEQSQLHADQKSIIKKALSSEDNNQKINKKIVFSDNEEIDEHQADICSKDKQIKNKRLFEDDNSSDSDLELKVNSQFKGKKGQKLLELQSKFASDSRFTLDTRFQDSESENEDEKVLEGNSDLQEEKKRQLQILESIVNQPIKPLSETKSLSRKRYDELMVRFDPTKEDHQKYLLKPEKPPEENKEPKDKKKKTKKEKFSLTPEDNKPEVSKERIYAVKDDLKEVLKKENKTEFSLLKLFGSKDENTNTQQEGSESMKKLKYATKNPFKYDSSESESEEEESKVEEKEKKIDKGVKPSLPSWRTTFFFTDNDSRFKEAEEFLRAPQNNEGDQEFAEKRKMLKDFIRHKVKNNNRKKDPFKKKLGSVQKKVFNKKKGK